MSTLHSVTPCTGRSPSTGTVPKSKLRRGLGRLGKGTGEMAGVYASGFAFPKESAASSRGKEGGNSGISLA